MYSCGREEEVYYSTVLFEIIFEISGVVVGHFLSQ